MEEEIPFGLGFIPSPPDYRDVLIGEATPQITSFPDSYEVDISQLPVWNQKKIGSCVGHASAKKKQQMDYVETKQVFPLSARFVYALCKSQDGIAGEGTYYRMAAKVLQQYGCATEGTVPNNCDLAHAEYINLKNIPPEAYVEAKQFAIKNYASVAVRDLDDIRRGILAGGTLIGLNLDKSWWTDKNGKFSYKAEDLFPLKPPTVSGSGHDTFAYKYETIDGRIRIWILNSWGPSWGINGTGYFWWDEYVNSLVEGWSFVDLPNDWQKEVKDLPPATTYKHAFLQNMSYGETSPEVRQLQIALKIDGTFPKTIAETGYYGPITQKAVYEFQMKYHVDTVANLQTLQGRSCGPKTRSKLNELFNK